MTLVLFALSMRPIGVVSTLSSTELFSPVAPISRFERERGDRPRERHGLAAYTYTRDLAWSMRVAATIETGMIALNRGLMSDPAAPFGGAKQSGIGCEGGAKARHRRVHAGEISRRRDLGEGAVRFRPLEDKR